LRNHPEAFSSAYEDEAAESLDTYKRMIATPPSATFGYFVDGALAGIAGLIVSPRLKLRHKGLIVGVYLQPAHRSHGLARRLIETVIEEGRRVGVISLHLNVTVGNEPAERLYYALGFRRYGVEERALRIGDVYVDEAMMSLDLD
jgi:GNAT superfamily N-acetyltransferase